MRRILLLIVVVLSLAIVERSSGQILFDENFSYPSGDSLTAHGWLRHSGTQGQILVATSGLTYSGYPLSNIGLSAKLDTVGSSGIDINKPITTPDSTNNVYVSFLVNVSYATSAGEYFFHVGNTTLATTFRGKVFAKDTLGTLRFGISKTSNTGTYSPVAYNYGTTYLIIVKYKFNTGSTIDDEVSMFVFNAGIPGSEPTATVGPLTEATANGDLSNFGTVVLRQGVNTARPILLIDGIRVFKTWGNLVSVSNISTVAENFSLSQNYPNPFNPSTKINFSLPERSFVTMKVYDMLGKEVMTLVNSNYSAGTYAVDMNAAALSTGIYMYSVEARTESGNILKDTKKLTLVK